MNSAPHSVDTTSLRFSSLRIINNTPPVQCTTLLLLTQRQQRNFESRCAINTYVTCVSHQSLSIMILQPYGLCFIFLVKAAMCFMLVHFASVQYPTSGSSCTPRKSTSLIAGKACRVVKGDATCKIRQQITSCHWGLQSLHFPGRPDLHTEQTIHTNICLTLLKTYKPIYRTRVISELR